METLRAVAGGEDPGGVGAGVVVDGDAPCVADRDAGGRGEGAVGLDAEPEDHHVGGQRPGRGLHAADVAVGDVEGLDALPDVDVDPDVSQRVGDERSHLGIEAGHRLRRRLDERHRQAPSDQGLTELEPDVAAADDHGVVSVVAFDLGADREPVVEGLHPEDACGVGPGETGAAGGGAGGDHELVVGLPRFVAAVDGADLHRVTVGVDGGDLVAGAHVDASTSETRPPMR